MHYKCNVHDAYIPHSAPRPGCNQSPSGPARQPTSSGYRRWKRNCCCRNSANCRNSAWTGRNRPCCPTSRNRKTCYPPSWSHRTSGPCRRILSSPRSWLQRPAPPFLHLASFVFILHRRGGPFRRAASLLCNAGTSKLRCRKAHQKRNDNSLCSHTDLPDHETGRWTLADIQRPVRFYICSRRFF